MSNKVKVNLGFETTEEDFTNECTSIFDKATTFIASQPEGSYKKFSSRSEPSGSYIYLILYILVEDIDDAKVKRTQIENSLDTLPQLMDGEKGWHFYYEEDGLPVEI